MTALLCGGRQSKPIPVQRCGPAHPDCDCPPDVRAAREAEMGEQESVQRDEVDGGQLTAPSCAANPGCSEDYCKPFASTQEAQTDREHNLGPALASVPNSKARGYFERWATNPGPAGEIGSDVGADFQRAAETRRVTQQLVDAVRARLAAEPPIFPPDTRTIQLPHYKVLAYNVMQDIMKNLRFTDYLEVPGLLAGGIDTKQGSCPVGKVPSTQPDSRTLRGSFTVSKNDDGSIFVSPAGLQIVVADTLDFCPGNCGGSIAQSSTVPMSRWEASGISGDVSFTVTFDAPPLAGSPD